MMDREKVPLWVSACRLYMLVLVVFSMVVPMLPTQWREATWVHRPTGIVIVLLACFCMPVALGGLKDHDTYRGRAWFGIVFSLFMGVIFASAAYESRHPKQVPAASTSKDCR